MISIIAAIGKNNELGKNNKLIWHLKEDLKFFKEKTNGKKIVMGKNTYLSLPKKLENREYIILSSSLEEENIKIYKEFDNLLNDLLKLKEEIMIIGGKSIYELFLPYASKLYLTHINNEFDADVFFPYIDENKYNIKIIKKFNENNCDCKILEYVKKSED